MVAAAILHETSRLTRQHVRILRLATESMVTVPLLEVVLIVAAIDMERVVATLTCVSQ